MRRYGLAVLVGAMALMVGCSGGDSGIQIEKLPSSSRTTAAPETQRQEQRTEPESSALSPEESLEAAVESLEEAVESMEAAVESMEAVVESVEAAESSIAEEKESLAEQESSLAAREESLTAESESEEEQEASYERLLETPDDFLGRELNFYGRVVQAVAVDEEKMQLLLAVNEDNATRIVAEYAAGLTPDVLEHGDIVTVTGEFLGMLRYRMGSGEVAELPTLRLSVLGVMKKADPLLGQTGEAETEAPGLEGDFSVGMVPGEIDESAGTVGPGEADTTIQAPENGETQESSGEADPEAESENSGEGTDGSGEAGEQTEASSGETGTEAETSGETEAGAETEDAAGEEETEAEPDAAGTESGQ